MPTLDEQIEQLEKEIAEDSRQDPPEESRSFVAQGFDLLDQGSKELAAKALADAGLISQDTAINLTQFERDGGVKAVIEREMLDAVSAIPGVELSDPQKDALLSQSERLGDVKTEVVGDAANILASGAAGATAAGAVASAPGLVKHPIVSSGLSMIAGAGSDIVTSELLELLGVGEETEVFDAGDIGAIAGHALGEGGQQFFGRTGRVVRNLVRQKRNIKGQKILSRMAVTLGGDVTNQTQFGWLAKVQNGESTLSRSKIYENSGAYDVLKGEFQKGTDKLDLTSLVEKLDHAISSSGDYRRAALDHYDLIKTYVGDVRVSINDLREGFWKSKAGKTLAEQGRRQAKNAELAQTASERKKLINHIFNAQGLDREAASHSISDLYDMVRNIDDQRKLLGKFDIRTYAKQGEVLKGQELKTKTAELMAEAETPLQIAMAKNPEATEIILGRVRNYVSGMMNAQVQLLSNAVDQVRDTGKIPRKVLEDFDNSFKPGVLKRVLKDQHVFLNMQEMLSKGSEKSIREVVPSGFSMAAPGGGIRAFGGGGTMARTPAIEGLDRALFTREALAEGEIASRGIPENRIVDAMMEGRGAGVGGSVGELSAEYLAAEEAKAQSLSPSLSSRVEDYSKAENIAKLGEAIVGEVLSQNPTLLPVEATTLASQIIAPLATAGANKEQSIAALLEIKSTFPNIFKAGKLGIPGEIQKDGKTIIPRPQDRIIYSQQLKDNPSLSPREKAIMRSNAHKGVVIDKPKKKKRTSKLKNP